MVKKIVGEVHCYDPLLGGFSLVALVSLKSFNDTVADPLF